MDTPTYSLEFDKRSQRWHLVSHKTRKPVQTYATKEEAVREGAFEKVLGADGGTVRIRQKGGRVEEERRVPQMQEPRT